MALKLDFLSNMSQVYVDEKGVVEKKSREILFLMFRREIK